MKDALAFPIAVGIGIFVGVLGTLIVILAPLAAAAFAAEVGAGAQRGGAEQVDGGGGVEVDASAHRHADVGGPGAVGTYSAGL